MQKVFHISAAFSGQWTLLLCAFAFTNHDQYFYIQNNEAPEQVEFKVHPEFFGFGKFLLHVGLPWWFGYSGISVQPGRALNFLAIRSY